jgi:hypothetical protein
MMDYPDTSGNWPLRFPAGFRQVSKFFITLKLGNKELFGRPKIVP